MSKDVFKELEESLYNPQVLGKIKNKLQLRVEEPKEALKVLKKNHFSLAKEVLSGQHYSVVADFSKMGFWHNRYVSKVRKIPGTIILKSYTSKDMKYVLESKPDFARTIVLKKIERLFGKGSTAYQRLEKESKRFTFWYDLICSLETQVFKKETKDQIRQPILLVSSSFVWQARAGGIGKDPDKKWEVLEAICKDFLINIVYFNESPSFSPWMEYLQQADSGSGQENKKLRDYFNERWEAKSNSHKFSTKEIERFLLENRVQRLPKDFSNYYKIEKEDYRHIWINSKAKRTVLKSKHQNEFLEYLWNTVHIDDKDLLESINLKQEIKTPEIIFKVLENNPQAEIKTSLKLEQLKIDTKKLYYTKDLMYFERCIKDKFYQETISTEENASLINHLLISEQWLKLEILKDYKLFNSEIKDEDGHTPNMVFDLLKTRSPEVEKLGENVGLDEALALMIDKIHREGSPSEIFTRLGKSA